MFFRLRSTSVIGRIAGLGLGLLLSLSGPDPAHAQTRSIINVAFVPNVFWALPLLVAREKGWWKQLGVEANYRIYAGGPAITKAGGPEAEWDIAGVGAPTALSGADALNWKIIGMTNDESAVTGIYASNDLHTRLLADSSIIKGLRLVTLDNSTADFVAQACLAYRGAMKADLQYVNSLPRESMKAVEARNTDLISIWAPFIFELETRYNMRPVCTGKDVHLVVPGLLVTRDSFAQDKPDLVAKFLAVYLHGWNWAKHNRKEAIDILAKFYKDGGVDTGFEEAITREFETRSTPDLQEQLRIMQKGESGSSVLGGWLMKMGVFLKAGESMKRLRVGETALAPEYAARVQADPGLVEFIKGK